MQLLLIGLSNLCSTFDGLSVTMSHLTSSVDRSIINIPYANVMRK